MQGKSLYKSINHTALKGETAMTTTIIALLLATVGTGVHQVEGVMIKKYNEKHIGGGFIFNALISLFAMLFFFITDKEGLCFPLPLILYGVISGIFFCMALILTFVALGCGSFVLSNLFLSYSLLFSVCYDKIIKLIILRILRSDKPQRKDLMLL